ncbi:MAG TPA: VWA domain-containing protein [Streptosporangiaceae bacterium]|nr:VWA domain-containing protein [Streptosporangiaceae bacterium]
MLAGLVDELRAAGIGVSVGEHLDAARAVSQVPLRDKEVLRAALQCALVKNADQLTAFNLIFDLYTSGAPASAGGPLSGLSDDELRAALRAAIGSGRGQLDSLLAAEYVRRFAGFEPGRPVAGVMYARAVAEAAGLDGLAADVLAGGLGGGGGGGGADAAASLAAGGLPGQAALRDRIARAEVDRAIARFRAEVQAAIQRMLVADRGARAVRATLRVRLAADADIATASAAELAELAAAIGPLSQQLSRVLSRQAAYRKRRLSIRATLRRAMGSGGVPFRLVTEPARPPKPEIVVLCDVSGSVSAFSRFTLDLLIALDSRLSRLRVFSFIDGLAEITGLVQQTRADGRRLDVRQVARESVRFSGSSDYGWVMREFAAQYASQLTRRSVVLVIGDARTNYLDPSAAAFAEIGHRAGRVYWLNPEPRRSWNDGDSVIGQYAPFCAQVQECRTLRQIAEFIQDLTTV